MVCLLGLDCVIVFSCDFDLIIVVLLTLFWPSGCVLALGLLWVCFCLFCLGFEFLAFINSVMGGLFCLLFWLCWRLRFVVGFDVCLYF